VTLSLILLLLFAGIRSVSAQSGQEGNFCVRDFQAGAVCTANDVRIEELVPISVIETCDQGVPNEAEVRFEALVSADGSPDRYDIGLYLALDGGSARDGDACLHDYLDPPLTTVPTYGDSNTDGIPDIYGGPWLDNDGDMCGDIATNTQVIKVLQTIRVACVDQDQDGFADISVCASWDNNANSTCSTISEAFPGTNSKCSCSIVNFPFSPTSIAVSDITTGNITSLPTITAIAVMVLLGLLTLILLARQRHLKA
jgi:hypothetical protein